MPRPIIIIGLHMLVALVGAIPGYTSSNPGRQTSRTPYDAKYRKVEVYLASIQQIQMETAWPSYARQLLRIRRYLLMAQHFRFEIEGMGGSGIQEDYWQLPDETEMLGTGDCEDLAIWLYCHLLKEGITNIRLTVGLAGAQENKSMHAWVTWYKRGETYILDPSRREGMYAMGQSGSITYQPYYSYCLDKRWHHQ